MTKQQIEKLAQLIDAITWEWHQVYKPADPPPREERQKELSDLMRGFMEEQDPLMRARAKMKRRGKTMRVPKLEFGRTVILKGK